MVDRVRNYMEAYGMTCPGDTVVIGLSGGADSVCLMYILLEVSRSMGFKVQAVHVHHGLRISADRDEEFVRKLCAEFNVPLEVRHVKADQFAQEHGMGEEEAGRILRRRIYDEVCAGCAAEGRVLKATAHHMNDQAETVLFHLGRGSSLRGLGGIRPASDGYIRPLLCCTRQEIEQWLVSRGISWCEDETNRDTEYARNCLRHEILPAMETAVNSQTVRHIAMCAEDLAEAEEYLKSETDKGLEACAEISFRKVRIRLETFRAYPPVLQKRILYRSLTLAAGQEKDIARIHIDTLLKMARNKQGSEERTFPYGVRASRTYELLHLTGTGAEIPEGIEYPLREEEYQLRVFTRRPMDQRIPRGRYTKWFDYDKIGSLPMLRCRQEGDRIMISSDGVCKRVSRCMIDMKIPAELRGSIMMAAVGRDILWIPGGPVHHGYYVTENTQRILEISWKHPENTGGGALAVRDGRSRENECDNYTDDQ